MEIWKMVGPAVSIWACNKAPNDGFMQIRQSFSLYTALKSRSNRVLMIKYYTNKYIFRDLDKVKKLTVVLPDSIYVG